MIRAALTFLCFFTTMLSMHAAVVVIANMTDKAKSFDLQTQVDAKTNFTLAPGESKAIPTGRSCVIQYLQGEQTTTATLNAWSVYAFATAKKQTTFTEIELAGKLVANADVLEKPQVIEPLNLKFKLYVDDANPFAQANWEPRIRRRLEIAMASIQNAVPCTFEIISVGTWKSDPDSKTMEEVLSDFEAKDAFEKGVVKIGFSSRIRIKADEIVPTSLMKQFAPLRPHLVIREGIPRSESEQAEFLTHELGRYFGAVTSPDPDSVMRTKLGDGRAVMKSFTIRFDPLNVLAMNLWASEMASGKVKSWQDLKPSTAARLARVYETLAKLDPADKQAEAIGALIAANTEAPVPAVNANAAVANPGNASTAKSSNSREQAVRRVLRGMTIRAGDNAKQTTPLKGDELTVMLIKTAADIALSEEESMQPTAFAIAVGLGLDDSTILRNNPLSKSLCEAVETNDEYKERVSLIKTATLHGRRDLCQHFSVSCALTEIVGAELARQAGLSKELADMKGTSGFSFIDLAVDYAGVEFITRMQADKHLLTRVRQSFRVDDYVTKPDGLVEGLTANQFAAQFGSIADKRFRELNAKLKEKAKSLGGYAK